MTGAGAVYAFGGAKYFGGANNMTLAAPTFEGGAGADVIVDDVAYYGEPFFQEGMVGNAIRKVTEAGVTYLTAGGNDNLVESPSGRQIASWERVKFHDTTCPSELALSVTKVNGASCHPAGGWWVGIQPRRQPDAIRPGLERGRTSAVRSRGPARRARELRRARLVTLNTSLGLCDSTVTSPALIHENTRYTSSWGPATNPSSDIDISATTVAISSSFEPIARDDLLSRPARYVDRTAGRAS